jgi:DUF177 domain-containing protein
LFSDIEAAMLITRQELELHRIVVSEMFVPGALDYHGAEFKQSSPLKVEVAAELAGPEIRIRGKLRTRVGAICDRCLAPVEIPIEPHFDLFYRPMETIAREEEVAVSTGDLEIGFYEGDGVELADVVTEQVILAMPVKVLCKEDCRGLCPVCGKNRNLEDCNCTSPAGESPFTALKGL